MEESTNSILPPPRAPTSSSSAIAAQSEDSSLIFLPGVVGGVTRSGRKSGFCQAGLEFLLSSSSSPPAPFVTFFAGPGGGTVLSIRRVLAFFLPPAASSRSVNFSFCSSSLPVGDADAARLARSANSTCAFRNRKSPPSVFPKSGRLSTDSTDTLFAAAAAVTKLRSIRRRRISWSRTAGSSAGSLLAFSFARSRVFHRARAWSIFGVLPSFPFPDATSDSDSLYVSVSSSRGRTGAFCFAFSFVRFVRRVRRSSDCSSNRSSRSITSRARRSRSIFSSASSSANCSDALFSSANCSAALFSNAPSSSSTALPSARSTPKRDNGAESSSSIHGAMDAMAWRYALCAVTGLAARSDCSDCSPTSISLSVFKLVTAPSPAATSANEFKWFARRSRCSSAQSFASWRGTPNACSVFIEFRATCSDVNNGAPSSIPASVTSALLVRSSNRNSSITGNPSTRAMRFEERFSSIRVDRHARNAGSTSMRLSLHPCTHKDVRFTKQSMCLICASDVNVPPYRDNTVTVSFAHVGSSRSSTTGRSNGAAVASRAVASSRDFAATSRRVCSTWYCSWSAARAARRVGLCRVGIAAARNARSAKCGRALGATSCGDARLGASQERTVDCSQRRSPFKNSAKFSKRILEDGTEPRGSRHSLPARLPLVPERDVVVRRG